MCLDMNEFYLGLVPEQERRRVESLEPFDEYEVVEVSVFAGLYNHIIVYAIDFGSQTMYYMFLSSLRSGIRSVPTTSSSLPVEAF